MRARAQREGARGVTRHCPSSPKTGHPACPSAVGKTPGHCRPGRDAVHSRAEALARRADRTPASEEPRAADPVRHRSGKTSPLKARPVFPFEEKGWAHEGRSGGGGREGLTSCPDAPRRNLLCDCPRSGRRQGCRFVLFHFVFRSGSHGSAPPGRQERAGAKSSPRAAVSESNHHKAPRPPRS